tara:strand:+ start:10045 stop:11178 length:1134 start_codon:yes stop_codon:yes gene_type:complete
MKLQVAKRDLESALAVVTNSMTTSGTDISSHFVFRADKDDKVEVLTFTGRLFSSAPVKCVIDSSADRQFTVEGARLVQWVKSVKDAALDLEFDPETKVVTARAPKGSMEFQSLDPSSFPFWDEMWPDVTEKGTVKAVSLAAGLSYARGFVFDKETKRPELCLIECKDGLIFATDQKAITLVEVTGLADSTLRIHRNDAGAVLKFLGTCGDEDVTLMEHDRSLLFKRADGAVFGESRFKAKYPPLNINRDNDNPIWWNVAKADILEAIPFLSSGAADKDNRLFFARPDPNGPVKIGMKAMTGNHMDIDITVVESGDDGNATLPAAGFMLDYTDLQRVLGTWAADSVTFGIHLKGSMGFVRFREEREDVDYTSVLAWLK